MVWSLYNNERLLDPLKFSNGKTQENIVEETLDAIKQGFKVIFINGMCGTGKSAIALNIAKELGKTSIVVPGKNLQRQYKEDYEFQKYLLKNNRKLKISILTGRNNHECLYIKDKSNLIPKFKREVNSKLSDIFDFPDRKSSEIENKDKSADNSELPCKIEIKEKNFRKIREYLKKNRNIDIGKIQKAGDVRRIPLASVCPYWSPVLPDKYELKNVSYPTKRSYEGLEGNKFTIYSRKPGCSFYEQYNSYIDSDVLVFNSLKYKLESAINRKPFTEAEIIDEGDEFLDSFSNQRAISLNRLQNSLIQVVGENESVDRILSELNQLLSELRNNEKIKDSLRTNGILAIRETQFYDLFRIFLSSSEFLGEVEEESYLFEVEETVKMFEDFLDETYLTFRKKDNDLIINVITTNLAKRFGELIKKNKIVILMSGTLHSEEVLEKVFGLEKFKLIDAETEQPGKLEILKTGLEMNCSYSNLNGNFGSRKNYLKALDKCVAMAKRPILVHVNAFRDLPDIQEIQEFGLKNLVTGEDLKNSQILDNEGTDIKNFKKGKIDVLFTTRCGRGVDFPGNQCNSIVFTKYPNPNPENAFWKILRHTRPQHYWSFYKDKAKRELLQKVYRGLRSKEDFVYLLSPDTRVLDVFDE